MEGRTAAAALMDGRVDPLGWIACESPCLAVPPRKILALELAPRVDRADCSDCDRDQAKRRYEADPYEVEKVHAGRFTAVG